VSRMAISTIPLAILRGAAIRSTPGPASSVGQPGWKELLEANRLAMYEAGLWGVPSFRLLNQNGEQVLALWGQDRLWLFAREIQRQLARRQ